MPEKAQNEPIPPSIHLAVVFSDGKNAQITAGEKLSPQQATQRITEIIAGSRVFRSILLDALLAHAQELHRQFADMVTERNMTKEAQKQAKP